ncbi:MAG: histidine kinase [Clostridia bacterium]|nr:histidine kinase [Clostridia bacterium]
MRDRMTAFMRAFLTQASELACVENAQGTHRVLTCASRLLRHMSDTGLAPLADELECLADYLSILKARFGNRFHLAAFPAEELFIERARVISFIDEHIDVERLLNDPDVEYRIEFERRLDVAQETVLRVRVRECGAPASESVCDLPL